jgi:hypothetical protein
VKEWSKLGHSELTSRTKFGNWVKILERMIGRRLTGYEKYYQMNWIFWRVYGIV